MNSNDLDDQALREAEGPLPFWLKALGIVMLVPFINSIVPGSIVAIFTWMGLPDPAEHGKKNARPRAGFEAVSDPPPGPVHDRTGKWKGARHAG